jgi:hypothetical protein
MFKRLELDRRKIFAFLRKTFASLCLSAGVLSVASIDSMYTEGRHAEDLQKAKVVKARKALHERMATSRRILDERGLALRESLAQDELGEVNPFTALSTLDPISEIFDRKVKRYARQAFRSPDHQDEAGYDLVHYEIELTDGGRADLLAYLERASLTAQRAVGAPDDRVAFVLVMSENKDSTAYAFYRAGELIENTVLPATEARTLVTQRLAAGVPFLSVAR